MGLLLASFYTQVEERDSEFEVLDVTDRGWLRKTFGDLTKASVAKQITVGGVSGWCAGYLFARVGKAAAAAVGGSLLLLQVAHHQGYIKINWNRVDRQMSQARRRLERDSDRILPWLAEEVKDFASENVVLATGFAGGFFLGIAS